MRYAPQWLRSWYGGSVSEHLSSDGGQTTLCGVEHQNGVRTTKRPMTPLGAKRCVDCATIWERLDVAVTAKRVRCRRI